MLEKKLTKNISLLTRNALMVNVLREDDSECASYHRFFRFYTVMPDDTLLSLDPLQHAL